MTQAHRKHSRHALKTALLPAVLLACTTQLSSCTYPNIQVTPAPYVAPASPQEFFTRHQAKAQGATLNVGTTPATVTYSGGTTLTFATDSLLKSDGTPYVGLVTVSVREIRTKRDMIFNNVLPVSDTSPLVTTGMIQLDIKDAGDHDLNINPARGVNATLPAINPAFTSAQLFLSNTCLTTPQVNAPCTPLPAGASSLNWSPIPGQVNVDTSTTPASYGFRVYKTDWVNVASSLNDPRPKGTIHVAFNGTNDTNTIVYLIPENVNTVMALYTPDGPNKRKSDLNSLPVGLEGEVVALSFHDKKQYVAHQTITVADGMTINLNLTETTENDIDTFLGSQ